MPQARAKQTPRTPQAATRKTVTVTREEHDEDVDEQAPEDDEYVDPTEEALESVFAEARGHSGVEIRVYKLDAANRSGARAYAMSVSLEDAEGGRLLDQLQRVWKGGEFELMARADGRIVKRAVIVVLPPPADPVPAPAQMQSDIAAAITAALEPVKATLAANAARPPFDFDKFMARAMQMLPLLQPLLTTFAGRGAAPPSDFMAGLSQLKQMREVMDMFGGEGGGNKPDTFDRAMQMFDKFGKPVLESLQQAAQANPRPAPRPQQRPGAARPVPVPQPVAAPVEVETASPFPLPGSIEIVLARVGQMAKAGESPESVAGLMLDVVSDEDLENVVMGIESGLLVKALSARPEFAGLTPWLTAVGKSFLEQLESEQGEEEAPDLPAGAEAGS